MSLVPFVHIDTSLAERGAGEEVELSDADRRHLVTVLRLRPGAEVVLADGRGHSAAAELTDAGARLRAGVEEEPRPRPTLTVAQGLPKGRKLDEIVRSCTELGVDRLVPVAASRSVSRLEGAKAAKAVERWRAVSRAASEQSRRPRRPCVSEIRPAASLSPEEGEALLVAHPGAPPLPAVLRALPDAAGLLLAVGPEGGWTDAEVATWEARGARAVGLGPTVLRTEHAAAAALAVAAAALGRWGG